MEKLCKIKYFLPKYTASKGYTDNFSYETDIMYTRVYFPFPFLYNYIHYMQICSSLYLSALNMHLIAHFGSAVNVVCLDYHLDYITVWFMLLTHWGRLTHMCFGNLTIIGSDNGLSPGRHQAIIYTTAGIVLIGPVGTNFSKIMDILFWLRGFVLRLRPWLQHHILSNITKTPAAFFAAVVTLGSLWCHRRGRKRSINICFVRITQHLLQKENAANGNDRKQSHSCQTFRNCTCHYSRWSNYLGWGY